jgi:SAM-dependent methyltransferase
MAQYTHTTGYHNMVAPREIAPVIYGWFSPTSVIDIGCGLGTFLKAFKEQGVTKILGIDGPWCNQELLSENIDLSEFAMKNIETALGIEERFDLLVCLEVAEHLTPNRADSFVAELVQISDVILFSAAIPGQGGDHHYNEQWIDYWKVKFENHGYEMRDVLRPLFWHNKKVYYWYRQNMVLFLRYPNQHPQIETLVQNTITNIVHPELLDKATNYRDQFAIKRFARALIKALLYRLKVIR